MNIFNKFRFFLTKPKMVVVAGEEREGVKAALLKILSDHFKIGKEVFLFEAGKKEIDKFYFYFKNSRLPVLAATDPGWISLAQKAPPEVCFVFNCDREKAKENMAAFGAHKVTRVGSGQKNDIFVSDIKINGGINFKINHKGSIVPFWLEEAIDSKEISLILLAVGAALALGLNLVEISQSLKNLTLKGK